MYPATVFADSGVGRKLWHIQPTAMPATIAIRIHVVSFIFLMRFLHRKTSAYSALAATLGAGPRGV
jgi:hypothetical protein